MIATLLTAFVRAAHTMAMMYDYHAYYYMSGNHWYSWSTWVCY